MILLQETNIKPRIVGYDSHTDKQFKRVATLTHKNVTVVRHPPLVTNVEHTLTEIIPKRRNRTGSILILNIYSPPRDRKTDLSEIIEKAKKTAGG